MEFGKCSTIRDQTKVNMFKPTSILTARYGHTVDEVQGRLLQVKSISPSDSDT